MARKTKIQKPAYCFQGCPLAEKGFGYAPPSGPVSARVLVVGEALGFQEALRGEPFVGPAGAQLDKCLRLISVGRDDVRVDNLCRCKPPGDWMDGAPWERGAINHCSKFLEETLNEGHNVVVPVGGIAIRRFLGFSPKQWHSFKKPMENFHGTVHTDPYNRFWIVPTWHPSFIIQGNHKLTGAVLHDLQLAFEIAENGYEERPCDLRVDPPVTWFNKWVDETIARAEAQFPEKGPSWLPVDIETPEKEKGVDESELEVDDPSYIITRINFAIEWAQDFAFTIPFQGPYIPGIKRLLTSPFLKTAFWNANFDRPRLIKNSIRVEDPWADLMDLWHILQPNLPRGLGFVTPFYSKGGPAWKHLASSEPGIYAAYDALMTNRCAVGIERDLKRAGLLEIAERHLQQFDTYAIKPAEEIGLLVDQDELVKFQLDLNEKRDELINGIRDVVPKELIPLVPKAGYKKQPVDKETKEPLKEYFPITKKESCYKCLACGSVDVTTKHRCKEKQEWLEEHPNGQYLEFGAWSVTKWYTQGQFNPESSQQILKYIEFQGHKPGRQKKTDNPSADADTIQRLANKHKKDPIYNGLLTLRKLSKVKNTYVDPLTGTDKKSKQLGADGRIHSVFTNAPYTMRLSSQGFNLQNVVSSGKREDLGLGERFRKCIIAAPGCKLLELDFSGIEAVMVAWFAGDEDYYRLAKISPHAFMVTHSKSFDGKPAQLDWSDEELTEYLMWVKHNKKYKLPYNKAKRTVHCLTPGHQVLTKAGWVNIEDYSPSDPVATWDNGEIKFDSAKKLEFDYNGEVLTLEGRAFSQIVTPEHRLPYWKGGDFKRYRLHAARIKDLPKAARIPVVGLLKGGQEEDELSLRLAVAIQGDGHTITRSVIFHLIKERKIQRLETLLNALKVKYSKKPCTDHPNGFHIKFSYDQVLESMDWLYGKDKKFDLERLIASSESTRLAFLNELSLWDGGNKGPRHFYFTCNEHNAYVAETIAYITNMEALVRVGPVADGNNKPFYRISFNSRKSARKPTPVSSQYTGKVYCLTVPSGFFMVRCNGKISVTGNSSAYATTARGIYLTHPDEFDSVKDAQATLDLFFGLFPKIRAWQKSVRQLAHKEHMIGGDSHPFKYRSYFWDVFKYTRINEAIRLRREAKGYPCVKIGKFWYAVDFGTEAKACIAFDPQSTAGGILREACLKLFTPGSEHYIGDLYYGKTPFRMPIHDSLVLEVPENNIDKALAETAYVMTLPVDEMPLPWNPKVKLTVDTEAEIGDNWGQMEEVDVSQWKWKGDKK